jgi:hypothetical protein
MRSNIAGEMALIYISILCLGLLNLLDMFEKLQVAP